MQLRCVSDTTCSGIGQVARAKGLHGKMASLFLNRRSVKSQRNKKKKLKKTGFRSLLDRNYETSIHLQACVMCGASDKERRAQVYNCGL